MGRLIDADELKDEIAKIAEGLNTKRHLALLAIIELIEEQPTAYEADSDIEGLRQQD